MNSYAHILIQDSSAVGETRRLATRFADDLGLSTVRAGAVAIVATELASNVIKHAGSGEFFLHIDHTLQHLHLIAHDQGRGMENVDQCMQAGYSTSRTAGNGLGAISRLPDDFDLYSVKDKGTTIACVFALDKSARSQPMIHGGLNLPYPGEFLSGDLWEFASTEDYSYALVSDGLGHGPEAHKASRRAAEAFQDNLGKSAGEILSQIHTALIGTRGAAVAVARIDTYSGLLEYAGIGNISGQIFSRDGVRSLISRDGIVGQNARKFESVAYPWSSQCTLIMFSDGLGSKTRMEPDHEPGLDFHSPHVIATRLLKTFLRGRDDASILVASQRLRRLGESA
ncbi:MAG: SpoIIE family protein phosphatase [Bdellovibrionota bacterium]|nr:MAG: serine/threonine protein kinase [Pseudomonadota bacterium]